MSGVVRRLLWLLLPPPEVRTTRARIREFLRRVSLTYPLPAELRRRALGVTRDAAYILELIRVGQRPPDQIALLFVSSTAISLLMSGRYHLYRGILSGEGHALVSVFTRCMSELQQRGYQTEEQTHEALHRIREEIQKTPCRGQKSVGKAARSPADRAALGPHASPSLHVAVPDDPRQRLAHGATTSRTAGQRSAPTPRRRRRACWRSSTVHASTPDPSTATACASSISGRRCTEPKRT